MKIKNFLIVLCLGLSLPSLCLASEELNLQNSQTASEATSSSNEDKQEMRKKRNRGSAQKSRTNKKNRITVLENFEEKYQYSIVLTESEMQHLKEQYRSQEIASAMSYLQNPAIINLLLENLILKRDILEELRKYQSTRASSAAAFPRPHTVLLPKPNLRP